MMPKAPFSPQQGVRSWFLYVVVTAVQTPARVIPSTVLTLTVPIQPSPGLPRFIRPISNTPAFLLLLYPFIVHTPRRLGGR